MDVLAAVSRATGSALTIEEIRLPSLDAGEVLVRLDAVGVCHTDIAAHAGKLPVPRPVVLGHEGAGTVARVGAGVPGVQVGSRVVISYASCGQCPSCAGGLQSYCHAFVRLNFTGERVNGGARVAHSAAGPVNIGFFGQSTFATYAVVNFRQLVQVDADLPAELLAPLGCGVLTGAGTIVNAFRMRPGDSLVVFGAGTVGLSAVMAARAVGAGKVIVVDPVLRRRNLAQSLGATATYCPGQEGLVQTLVDVTGGGANYVLESTGKPSVIEQAVATLGIRGTCGLVGSAPEHSMINVDSRRIMNAGRMLRGIVEGDSAPADLIPRLLQWCDQGRLPIERLVQTYAFQNINQAFADSESGAVVKPVLCMPS